MCASASGAPDGALPNARAAIHDDAFSSISAIELDPVPLRLLGRHGVLVDDAAVTIDLHGLDRRDLARATRTRTRHAVRPRPGLAMIPPGAPAVDFEQEQRPGGDEAAALGRAAEPASGPSAVVSCWTYVWQSPSLRQAG